MSGNPAGLYALGSNLDAAATSGWNAGAGFVPVTGAVTPGVETFFTGAFDGFGHTISNLTINRPAEAHVGLFGSSTGALRNIGLVGGTVNANDNAGQLTGHNYSGTITNSYATGTVSSSAVSYTIGGLVGYITTND